MKEFITAWQFLTRIRLSNNPEISGERLAGAYVYFPLVGLIIGALLALLGWGAAQLFQPLTVVILVVTGEIIITGGLHLDGFMDTCDGLFSGRERERILEIMKDSRVGSMGVLGCLVLTALKIGFLNELAGTAAFLPVLAAMPVISRWTMVLAMVRYPYARAQGLGGLFRSGVKKQVVYGVSLYSAVLALAILPGYLWAVLLLTIPLILWTAGLINEVLGGHTGDTYGFMNEISGLFLIMATALVYRIMLLIC